MVLFGLRLLFTAVKQIHGELLGRRLTTVFEDIVDAQKIGVAVNKVFCGFRGGLPFRVLLGASVIRGTADCVRKTIGLPGLTLGVAVEPETPPR